MPREIGEPVAPHMPSAAMASARLSCGKATSSRPFYSADHSGYKLCYVSEETTMQTASQEPLPPGFGLLCTAGVKPPCLSGAMEEMAGFVPTGRFTTML